MAIAHLNASVISRSNGSSAVASAAYRSGDILHDERAQKTFDYSRKEDILHTEILAPDHAPEWASDRAMLWNQVEASEKRKDAQLARSIIAGLQRELSFEQNKELVREFVAEHFTKHGMIADVAFHESASGDGGRNPHVHIMLTMRDVSAEGFGPKNREWNAKERVSRWRESWESLTNRYLEDTGQDVRIAMASNEARGIVYAPTKHMGHGAHALEKHGVNTAVGDENRRIRADNALLAEHLGLQEHENGQVSGALPGKDNQPMADDKERRGEADKALAEQYRERQAQEEATGGGKASYNYARLSPEQEQRMAAVINGLSASEFKALDTSRTGAMQHMSPADRQQGEHIGQEHSAQLSRQAIAPGEREAQQPDSGNQRARTPGRTAGRWHNPGQAHDTARASDTRMPTGEGVPGADKAQTVKYRSDADLQRMAQADLNRIRNDVNERNGMSDEQKQRINQVLDGLDQMVQSRQNQEPGKDAGRREQENEARLTNTTKGHTAEQDRAIERQAKERQGKEQQEREKERER